MMESLEPRSGQYSLKVDLRLNAWLGVAALVYLAGLTVNHQHPAWSPWLRGGLALTPLLPGLAYLRSWVRFIRGLDELQRRIQLEAFLFAALTTVFLGVVLDVLAAEGLVLAGLPSGLGFGGMLLAMFCFWLVGWAIAKCRYQ